MIEHRKAQYNARRTEQFRALCTEGRSRKDIAEIMQVTERHVAERARDLGLPVPAIANARPKPKVVKPRTGASLWDEERIAVLRQHWGDKKLNSHAIALLLNTAFGSEFTRNAVIGKAHREGLASKDASKGGRRPAVRSAITPEPKRVTLAKSAAPILATDTPTVARPVAELVPPAPIALAPAEPKPSKPAPKIALAPSPVPTKDKETSAEPASDPGGGVSIFALRFATRDLAGTCRWPLDGDKTSITTRYCGADTAFGKVYCCEHRRIAYPNAKFRPPPPRFIKPVAADRVFGVHTV
jgi:GcrA cell cycle regulator